LLLVSTYKRTVELTFENFLKAPKEFELRIGAQVMLLKNETSSPSFLSAQMSRDPPAGGKKIGKKAKNRNDHEN